MVTLEAVADETVYRNEDNGYTVLIVRKGRNRLTAVGAMPEVAPGERLNLGGEWVEHPVYGKQLKVSSVEILKPSTLRAIEQYLGSGFIRGIGPATARLIVDSFGLSSLDVLGSDPEQLLSLPGIGPKRLETIVESYAEHSQQREAMMLLQGYHVSPALAMKIYKKYGDDVRLIIESNPYRLIRDIEGVGFKTADQIAASIGIDPNSEFRLEAGLLYVLTTASANGGHCFLPRSALVREATRLLSCEAEMADRALDALIIEQAVKAEFVCGNEDDPAVYDVRAWRAEAEVALRLTQQLACAMPEAISDADIDACIDRMERLEGVVFHEMQRKAMHMAIQSPICVITGGPGTGKTTIIKTILSILGEQEDVALAAPTGRAAKRMSEACGKEAKTIHRLLEYSGEGGTFLRNLNDPLSMDTLIVDEMSMVDIQLMRSLLQAIPPESRIIFVGDADQLPSVGAGNVLRDMLESGALPSVRLSEIFRQGEGSMIVQNAHRINRGLPPRLNAKGGDFFFERAATPRQATECILTLCGERIPNYLAVDPVRQIQVLSPAKKGECGVWELNQKLQQRFNPPVYDKPEKIRGDVLFRVGDKVMQTKNNYTLTWLRETAFGEEEGSGVFNGDIGFIETIDEEEGVLTVRFDDDRLVDYAADALEDLELAYCISIHKSQGSEFPVVVMPVIGGPYMLMNRNLLYTAVTRAKRLVMLVGKEAVIDQMIRNTDTHRRYTALAWRMAALAETAQPSDEWREAMADANPFE